MGQRRNFPIEFDELSLDEVVSYCMQQGDYRYIVTPNVDHMCRIYKDPAILDLYLKADLCVCDSKILQYISKIFMTTLIRNIVRGSDLVDQLLKKIPQGKKVLIIGDSDKLKSNIKKQYGLSLVDVHTPPMGFASKPELIELTLECITNSGADIILLSVGSPRQELLANKLLGRTKHGVAICCGNAVNFAVGRVKRSPKWMSYVGIEWLHRIFTEPSRMIERYIKNLEIFLWIFRHRK